MQSETINDLSAALAKAQAVMKSAPFDRTNPHFKNKYATLASVIDTVRAALAEHGLSVTQAPQIRENGFALVTTLRHSTGQWVSCEWPLPTGVRPQEMGSALTYARRYSLSALVCIAADDDDDAEGARKEGHKSSEPRPSSHATQPTDVVPDVEYDAQGDPVDNIPRGDPRIKQLPKAHAKAPYAKLQNALLKITSLDALKEWGIKNANEVESLPIDFQETIRGQYEEMKLSIKSAQAKTHCEFLQSAMLMAKSEDELIQWTDNHADQIAALGEEWRAELRKTYGEHMTDLRAAQEAAQ
jgi:hypothetical protein